MGTYTKIKPAGLTKLNNAESVSYTHLDVYKRQALKSVAPGT